MKIDKIMATKKLVRTTTKRANKSGKTALLVAMAAITGSTIAQESEAMHAAMQDMKADGHVIQYTYNPFDGILA